VERLRDVLRALTGQVERGDALFLAERERRVGGVRSSDDQRVIVAERCLGEVARVAERERPPFRREPHTRALEIARAALGLAGEEEHEATDDEIAQPAARGLPANVLGARHAVRRAAELFRQGGGVGGDGRRADDGGSHGRSAHATRENHSPPSLTDECIESEHRQGGQTGGDGMEGGIGQGAKFVV